MTSIASEWRRNAEHLRKITWEAVDKCNEAACYEAQDATMKIVLIKQLLRAFLHSPKRSITSVAKAINLSTPGVYLRIKLLGLTADNFREACMPKENNYTFDFDQSVDQLVKKSVIPTMIQNASRFLIMKNPPPVKSRRRR